MEILKELKEAVIAIEPEAEIYLFGSRARGTHSEDSDWDVLVLVPGKVDGKRKERIWNSIYNIELANYIMTSIAVRSKEFWNNNQIYHETEFYQNLSKDMQMI